MSLRKTLNQYSRAISIVAVVAIALALWFSLGSGSGPTRSYGPKMYFSDDDGKTYFVGDRNTVVPYTKDGKEVVRAYVYKCPSKGTFIGYLQRFTPDAVAQITEAKEAVAAGRKPKNPGAFVSAEEEGSEYKLPGAGNPWKRGQTGDVVAGNIMALCGNKPNEFAEAVIP